jgi:ABC-type multidrug transport system permease subunit
MDEKGNMLDKATDFASIGYLTAWLNNWIVHGEWTSYTAFLLFIWTALRMGAWIFRRVEMRRRGRGWKTISKDTNG